jgi:hypothetical protein
MYVDLLLILQTEEVFLRLEPEIESPAYFSVIQ